MKEDSKKRAQWRLKNPEKDYINRLRRDYGLTAAQYRAILIKQDAGCAICGVSQSDKGARLSVDHDHLTGMVRGLLCRACNRSLGGFKDDPELLRRAAEYLHWELVKP
jgi:hypothetical protein